MSLLTVLYEFRSLFGIICEDRYERKVSFYPSIRQLSSELSNSKIKVGLVTMEINHFIMAYY